MLSINCAATLCSLYRKEDYLDWGHTVFPCLGSIQRPLIQFRNLNMPSYLTDIEYSSVCYLLTFKCENLSFWNNNNKVYISWITNFFLDLLLIQMIFSLSLSGMQPYSLSPSFFFSWASAGTPNKLSSYLLSIYMCWDTINTLGKSSLTFKLLDHADHLGKPHAQVIKSEEYVVCKWPWPYGSRQKDSTHEGWAGGMAGSLETSV